jgi:hypothetical protein
MTIPGDPDLSALAYEDELPNSGAAFSRGGSPKIGGFERQIFKFSAAFYDPRVPKEGRDTSCHQLVLHFEAGCISTLEY